MKLSATMELVRIKKYKYGYKKNHPLEYIAGYTFWNTDQKYIVLTSGFECIGYSPNWYIPIMNFGYTVGVRVHDVKQMYFIEPEDLDDQSGLSTQKYFSSKEDRSIVFKILTGYLRHYLRQFLPPVIIRGPILQVQRSLSRYQIIGEILQSYGYEEKIYKVSQMPEGLKSLRYNDNVPEDEMRIYVKTPELWEELEEWKPF